MGKTVLMNYLGENCVFLQLKFWELNVADLDSFTLNNFFKDILK